MKNYIYKISELSKEMEGEVGNKALNLAELNKIEGISLPEGFVLTADAYRDAIAKEPGIIAAIQELNKIKSNDLQVVAPLSERIRSLIEGLTLNPELVKEIRQAIMNHGSEYAYAIRSSATAEDLPAASFAGQLNSFLHIQGEEEILAHILLCWSSLFTERAIIYRRENGFDHDKVLMAVILQKMVLGEVSGIMFTADPMTSDRKTLIIDAGYGLGEGMVSGLVNPDIYRVSQGKVVSQTLGDKKREIVAATQGTIEKEVPKHKQSQQALSEKEILHLAGLGKRIEAYFEKPQDIEWTMEKGKVYMLQSRSITTLFPLPDSGDNESPRVFMSVGHTQMMTDAIKPLGKSFFESFSKGQLEYLGGRIFTDITQDLLSPIGRKRLIIFSGKQDPLIQTGLHHVLKDKPLMASLPKGKRKVKGGILNAGSIMESIATYRKPNPNKIKKVTTEFDKGIQALSAHLSKLKGSEALEYIQKDRNNLLKMMYNPFILGATTISIVVNDSLNKNIEKWMGVKNATDRLLKSLPHNITAEMTMALCDLSDKIRPYPEIIEYLSGTPSEDNFFESLERFSGGKEIKEGFQLFFVKFGMRCPGEIDISRDRFQEKPTQLIPVLLANIKILKKGQHLERFQLGLDDYKKWEQEILEKVSKLPKGEKKARRIQKNITILRNFSGCREDPKYYLVKRFQVYKEAIKKEAQRLTEIGQLQDPQDIYYLFFEELLQVAKGSKVDYGLIEERKEQFMQFEKLTPPRIITSEGWVPPVTKGKANLPENALEGIAVSSGIVEGRARVILSMENASLEEGDILVTEFTDPSWTPLFVNIKGLVTEVGGLITHSAVITRGYGLPGVVGVKDATKRIKDGERIRVNGDLGIVEIIQ